MRPNYRTLTDRELERLAFLGDDEAAAELESREDAEPEDGGAGLFENLPIG